LYEVLDAISLAARNVSVLFNRNLEVPPVPIKSVRKQEDTNVGETDVPLYTVIEPLNIVKVYEVWKVFLQKAGKDDPDHVYVVVSADYTLQGYRNGSWSQVEYKGFYTTVEEAQNEISGYLR
jgi:hypothetical protein